MKTLRSVRALSFAFSVFALALPAVAQQAAVAAQSAAAAAGDITVNGKEVNLLAIVRDKKGQPVTTLNQQDFVLEQDGRTQTITQFARESDTPLTVGIVADTGPGEHKALADERKAATEFVNRLLRDGKDKAFVLHFDQEVELLQDVTASHEKIAKAIDEISVGEQARNAGGGRGRGGDDGANPHYFFGGGMLYDAIFLASDEVLKDQHGRKAMVVFSDGADRDSRTSLERAIEAAERADTLVYCVFVASEREEQERPQGGGKHGGGGGFPGGGSPFPGGGGGYPGGGGRQRAPESTPRESKIDGKKILQQIARETGGKYFELSKKMSAAQIYAQIEEEMRHEYSFTYTPDKAEHGYHKLHLSTRNADLSVETRAGFNAE